MSLRNDRQPLGIQRWMARTRMTACWKVVDAPTNATAGMRVPLGLLREVSPWPNRIEDFPWKSSIVTLLNGDAVCICPSARLIDGPWGLVIHGCTTMYGLCLSLHTLI